MASHTSTRGKGTAVAFMAGALSATCSTLLFQPFDLVKTRMQVSSLPVAGPPVYLTTTHGGTVGMLNTFTRVVRRENFSALWTGTSASLQRCVPSIGVYFATLHFLKSLIGKTDGDISPMQSLVIGASARSFVASSFLPITVVKTRYESGRFHYRSVFQALRSIWYTEGGKGLYSGLWATLARDAPFSALYFSFYTQLKQAVMKVTEHDQLPSVYHFPCGVVAGVLASVTTQPADVVKTRMQLQPQVYSSVFRTLTVVLREESARGLFTGLLPRATRRTLMAALTWACYEEIVRIIQRRLHV